LLGER